MPQQTRGRAALGGTGPLGPNRAQGDWLRRGKRTSVASTGPWVLRRPVPHPPTRRVSPASPTSTGCAVDCEGRGLPEVPRISRRPQWRSARLGPGCVAEVKAFPEYMLWEGEKHQNSGRKVRGAGQGPTGVGAWDPGAGPPLLPHLLAKVDVKGNLIGLHPDSPRLPSHSTAFPVFILFLSALFFRFCSPFTVMSSILLLTTLLPPFWPTLHIFARFSLLPCVFFCLASLFHLFSSVPRMFYILAKKCIQHIFCCHLPASGSYYRICEPPAF